MLLYPANYNGFRTISYPHNVSQIGNLFQNIFFYTVRSGLFSAFSICKEKCRSEAEITQNVQSYFSNIVIVKKTVKIKDSRKYHTVNEMKIHTIHFKELGSGSESGSLST